MKNIAYSVLLMAASNLMASQGNSQSFQLIHCAQGNSALVKAHSAAKCASPKASGSTALIVHPNGPKVALTEHETASRKERMKERFFNRLKAHCSVFVS